MNLKNQKQINKIMRDDFIVDRSKPDQVAAMIDTRIKAEKLVYEEWKNELPKNFSAKELEYLKNLYASPLMQKFFIFNNTFAERKDIQEKIRTTLKTKLNPKKAEAVSAPKKRS